MSSLTQQELISLLDQYGIDWKTSFYHLDRFNKGLLPSLPQVDQTIPQIDGNQIIDRAKLPVLTIHKQELKRILGELSISDHCLDRWISLEPDPIVFTENQYETLGLLLMPWVSYGVLNGGMATSYCDKKKNQGANPHFYTASLKAFETFASEIQGKPKALAPGYYNQDLSPGENFLYLKTLSALQIAKKRQTLLVNLGIGQQSTSILNPLFPFFQMTSDGTNRAIQEGIELVCSDEHLINRAQSLGIDLGPWLTEIQPLLAAYTDHPTNKHIFLSAWGKPDTPLGLPGGHGQNFQVLAPVYKHLYDLGKRFVYLSNIDNLGATPDPGALGYLILKEGDGAFDFSFKTKVDTKGGILVRTTEGKLTCGDIGPAITPEQVEISEQEGASILFNCATGLFRLDRLIDNLPRIIDSLPVRFSNQSKDVGNYSQAEQVTWEVISLFDNPIILGVNKFERFLAAKMITDSFVTSGICDLHHHELEQEEIELAKNLQFGLEQRLTHQYGLLKQGHRWKLNPEFDHN
jgi:UTP--glucose-1-phosphate uridylyltransferase